MNPIVISTIIGAGSFILTIFSATYLNHRHVDKLIEQMEKRFEARIDALRADFKAEIGAFRAEVKVEIAEVKAEQRITNHRLEAIENRFKPVAAD